MALPTLGGWGGCGRAAPGWFAGGFAIGFACAAIGFACAAIGLGTVVIGGCCAAMMVVVGGVEAAALKNDASWKEYAANMLATFRAFG